MLVDHEVVAEDLKTKLASFWIDFVLDTLEGSCDNGSHFGAYEVVEVEVDPILLLKYLPCILKTKAVSVLVLAVVRVGLTFLDRVIG